MSAPSFTPWSFKMTSDPFELNFDYKQTLRAFKRIYFTDSIFDFFPYGEVYFNDQYGSIVDWLYFVEGLAFDVSIGTPEQKLDDPEQTIFGGYLENRYIWANNQVNNPKTLGKNIVADNAFVLRDVRIMNDKPSSRAFNDTVYNIVNQIAINDFGFKQKTTADGKHSIINISEGLKDVSTKTIWYQGDLTTAKFVNRRLQHYGYDSIRNNSSLFSFINCRGEFYFMSLQDLLNQAPVATYTLERKADTPYNPFSIKDFVILNAGIDVNQENYHKKFYRLNETGVADYGYKNIHDMHVSPLNIKNAEYVLIRKEYQQCNSIDNLGIYEETNKSQFRGVINRFFRDSQIGYRMEIIMPFNPQAVSGKTINMDIQKLTKDSQTATEFGGVWLITSSDHLLDLDGAPYSKLTISKSAIRVDDGAKGAHPFVDQFVKQTGIGESSTTWDL